MVSLLAATLTALHFSFVASTAPAESIIEARKPDHWGSVAWGDINSGACGFTGDNELVAAVSPLLYDNEHPCGRTMVVKYGENSVVVEVVDRCADCTGNDLVVSPAAFQKLIGHGGVDSEDAALINATWDFQLRNQC